MRLSDIFTGGFIGLITHAWAVSAVYLLTQSYDVERDSFFQGFHFRDVCPKFASSGTATQS